ncbi:HigA family addiction module antitoxin [Salinibacterium sp.]|uniref:HigA family addiction module antitoxin n=1 Tax=Salinibacterium sp. TaxID=1915057 RepID=UPI00286B1DD5|nr:HigA family addiction module antitoxin [Salinibacterium sp.]
MSEQSSEDRTWIPYAPDRVSSPGETLRETLEALPMSQTDLAVRTGLSMKHINQIVSGTAALSHETAIKLERATGVSARYWNALESQYRDWLAREAERSTLSADLSWLKKMPLASLRKRGILTATAKEPTRQLQEVLAFFGVSTVAAWEDAWAIPSAAFLQSAAFEADPGAVAAWLRLGEMQASKMPTRPFDRSGLKQAIPELRALTVLPPEEFWPQVQSICADVGVAVILVPEVTGARASGATLWLSPTKALVQLSARHKRNDHLWFALFHELAHVLFHGKKEVFVEYKLGRDGGRMDEELEANNFASRTLIPLEANDQLEGVLTPGDAIALATELGVHPGIVAGRIQHNRAEHTFGVPKLFTSLVISETVDQQE